MLFGYDAKSNLILKLFFFLSIKTVDFIPVGGLIFFLTKGKTDKVATICGPDLEKYEIPPKHQEEKKL